MLVAVAWWSEARIEFPASLELVGSQNAERGIRIAQGHGGPTFPMDRITAVGFGRGGDCAGPCAKWRRGNDARGRATGLDDSGRHATAADEHR